MKRNGSNAVEPIEPTPSFLESIIENIPDMIFIKDAKDLRFVAVNAAVEKLLGYSRQDMIGKTDYDFFPKGEADFFTTKDREVLEGKKLVEVAEEPIQTRRLGLRILHTKKIPILDAQGLPIYLLGISEDITDRKHVEEELRILNENLERRVAERSAAAEHRAQDLARTNAELERFAYMASHDLQEPLRMVTSYVQLLGRRYQGKLDRDADEFIQYAVDGANRMKALIQGLLDYSRIGRKSMEFSLAPSQDALNLAVANLQLVVKESGAEVTWDVLPTIHTNTQLLAELFQNLINNALKFRPKDTPPHIHVSVTWEGTEWVFSVRDNGIGIAPEHAERIFEIFKRLHTREEYPGTGIGLAICKKIVERHGGRIWVASQVGQGSTFYFTIPLRKESSWAKAS